MFFVYFWVMCFVFISGVNFSIFFYVWAKIRPKLPNNSSSNSIFIEFVFIFIFSVDARKGQSLDAARKVTDESLAQRSFMSTSTHPYAHLVIEAITADDAGEYACRVDFRKERTRNSVVFLKVISKFFYFLFLL